MFLIYMLHSAAWLYLFMKKQDVVACDCYSQSLLMLCAQLCWASCPSANAILVTYAFLYLYYLNYFLIFNLLPLWQVFVLTERKALTSLFVTAFYIVTNVIITSALISISWSCCSSHFSCFTTILLGVLQSGWVIRSVGKTCPKKFSKW